jgi:hypothetical protein
VRNLLCRLYGHDFERVTDWWPVVGRCAGLSWDESIRVLAVGRCRRRGCGKFVARTVHGTHEWGYRTGKHEVSPEQAVARWRAELVEKKVPWDLTHFTAQEIFNG